MSRTTSTEPEDKVQQLAAEIESMSAEVIQEVAEILNATPDREIFGDTEFVVRSRVLKIVAKAFTARLAQKTATSAAIRCPHCKRSAQFQGYRDRKPVGLGGQVICNRAYYYCGVCGRGSFPWDQEVGLTDQNLTPGVDRLATLTGAVADSLRKAVNCLRRPRQSLE